MEEILEIIKKRILLAEDKKKNSPTEEMTYFWDGALRCAQVLLNDVAHLTQRALDEAKCTECLGVEGTHSDTCPNNPANAPRK